MIIIVKTVKFFWTIYISLMEYFIKQVFITMNNIIFLFW